VKRVTVTVRFPHAVSALVREEHINLYRSDGQFDTHCAHAPLLRVYWLSYVECSRGNLETAVCWTVTYVPAYFGLSSTTTSLFVEPNGEEAGKDSL
jgi:hypothetical protein